MPSTRKDRENTVEQLLEEFKKCEGVVFAQYGGIATAVLNELRAKLRPSDSSFRVVKNTLTKVALKKANGLSGCESMVEGQVAVVFQRGDALAATKILADFGKIQEKFKIQGGYFQGQVVDGQALKELAALPSKEALLGHMAATFQAPLQQFHDVLAAPLKYLLNALNQAAEKKQDAKS